jgi:hypothetical protein
VVVEYPQHSINTWGRSWYFCWVGLVTAGAAAWPQPGCQWRISRDVVLVSVIGVVLVLFWCGLARLEGATQIVIATKVVV